LRWKAGWRTLKRTDRICVVMRLRERVASLGPYASLTLVLVPLLIVEPLKLVAVLIAGEGHWLTGTAVLIGAYAASLLGVERLLRLLKPNIRRARPLRRAWNWLTVLRRKGLAWARSLLAS
jgi:hypothetical protein